MSADAFPDTDRGVHVPAEGGDAMTYSATLVLHYNLREKRKSFSSPRDCLPLLESMTENE